MNLFFDLVKLSTPKLLSIGNSMQEGEEGGGQIEEPRVLLAGVWNALVISMHCSLKSVPLQVDQGGSRQEPGVKKSEEFP